MRRLIEFRVRFMMASYCYKIKKDITQVVLQETKNIKMNIFQDLKGSGDYYLNLDGKVTLNEGLESFMPKTEIGYLCLDLMKSTHQLKTSIKLKVSPNIEYEVNEEGKCHRGSESVLDIKVGVFYHIFLPICGQKKRS